MEESIPYGCYCKFFRFIIGAVGRSFLRFIIGAVGVGGFFCFFRLGMGTWVLGSLGFMVIYHRRRIGQGLP
jgi:hypothetical protein